MVAAVRVHKFGGPEVLTYEDVAVPPTGPGQIRVKQHAIGVNFTDVYFRIGLYPAPGGLPFILVRFKEGCGGCVNSLHKIAIYAAIVGPIRVAGRPLRCVGDHL